MTQKNAFDRIDVNEALWRISILEEIQTAGLTLSAHQAAVLRHARYTVATEQPVTFGSGTGKGALRLVTMVSTDQLSWLRKEIPRRETTAPIVVDITDKLAAGGDPMATICGKEAAAALTILFAAPLCAPSGPLKHELSTTVQQPRNAALRVTDPGVYRTPAGDVYRVQASRGSTNLYANKLDTRTNAFIYVKGAIYTLTADMRLSVKEARTRGVVHGWCVNGHQLSRPKSLRRRMGDVCAKKAGKI